MLPTLLVPGSLIGVSTKNETPINYIVNWIKNRMPEYGSESAELTDRILVIKAMTGSGKSTILPVELFRILRNKDTNASIKYRGKNVICTQPRIITAISLANAVSDIYPDMIVGKTVGYQTRPVTEKPFSGLVYATLGILGRQFSLYPDDKIMNLYKFIIVDEVHERGINTDLLLLMLYNFYKRNIGNKNLPFLILTSATIDTDLYASYFEVGHNNILNIVGSIHKINTIWAKHDVQNIYDEMAKTITEINSNYDEPGKGDILVFLPGVKEITLLYEKIVEIVKDSLILKITGEVVEKKMIDYILLMEDVNKLPKLNNSPPNRRIILSTAVTETGLTIKSCKYVIDIGLHRAIEYYPIINARGLITKPAPKSRITQRMGRVGRLFPGVFYPMYSKATFDALADQQLPDILVEGYKNIHLLLNSIQEGDITKLKLLDFPSHESLIEANSLATLLGFINYESKLTDLGKIVSKFFYTSMEQAKVIFSGFYYNTSILDLITICAVSSFPKNKLFALPYKFKKYVEQNNININIEKDLSLYVLKFILPDYLTKNNTIESCKKILSDDFIEGLLIFEAFVKVIMFYKNVKQVELWCLSHALDFSTLQSIYYIRENIIEDLLVYDINLLHNEQYSLINQPESNFLNTVINIKQCLYEGYKYNIIKKDKYGYITNQGININIKGYDFKYAITDSILISLNQNSDILIYDLNVNYISVLNGFISFDTSFGDVIYNCNIPNSRSIYDNTLNLYNYINSEILNNESTTDESN
jgi:HrpA-like RNA helicase